MKKRWRIGAFVVTALLASGMFSGCGYKNPFQIDASQVLHIWMDTQPEHMDRVRFTEDESEIDSIVTYINDLELRPATAYDQQLAGRGINIEILFRDGTRRTFSHEANVYFSEVGQSSTYVMKKKQGEGFEEIYTQTPKPTLTKGTVLEVREEKNGRQSMLVDVNPDERGFLDGETIVSVEPQRIVEARSFEPTQANVGDEIGFYVEGFATLSMPPMCGAWKVYVVKAAQPER